MFFLDQDFINEKPIYHCETQLTVQKQQINCIDLSTMFPFLKNFTCLTQELKQELFKWN